MNDYVNYKTSFSIQIEINGIYIIHILKPDTNLYLYINDILDEKSISYESLYYCIKLKKNDIITINDNNNKINLLNNLNIYKI